MNIFGIDVLQGIIPVAVVYIGFSIVYLLNMIGGVIINCQIDRSQKFSIGKFLLSFEKVIFCAIVMFGVVVALNLVNYGLFTFSPEMHDMITAIISIGTFILLFAKGFLQKGSDLVEKIKYLLEISSSNDVDQNKLNKFNEQNINDLTFDPALEPPEEHLG